MKTILIIIISLIVLSGCKKDKVVPKQQNHASYCTPAPAYLSGKYIYNEGSPDTVYVKFIGNLCPVSIYNRYTITNLDSCINKISQLKIPYKVYTVDSNQEGEKNVFANGDNLVVSFWYENGYPKISFNYNKQVYKVFIKVQ